MPSSKMTMCKQNDVWKIAARRYYLNFEAPYQGGWAALKPVSRRLALGRRAGVSRPMRRRPSSYQPFPAVFRAAV